MYLSQNITFLRRRRCLTQSDFAEKIGVEQAAVANWENGNRTPSIDTLVDISEMFSVTLDDLVKKDLSPVFPKRLRKLREDNHLKQSDIAKVVGVNNATYSKYESGMVEPPLFSILTLAKFFGVTTDYLLGLSDERR